MRGKLLVIEGLDGSGKATQSEILAIALSESGINCRLVSFPTYDTNSSAMIKAYLNGELGNSANDVNCYAASTFYAIDRYASFICDWEKEYNNNTLIIANRYTTSNMVHQTSKLPKNEWEKYIDWLKDFEYNKMGIPAPDMVIYLDMPVEVSQKLITSRYGGDESKKDLHERDINYLKNCHCAANFAAQYCGWNVLSCVNGDEIIPASEMHKIILKLVKNII